ncbi:hypothetical protein J6590_065836 [Homalodisca vitripennis]|nr:hypothetical protein J6590_065836 [Homalodisca vitripennis]
MPGQVKVHRSPLCWYRSLHRSAPLSSGSTFYQRKLGFLGNAGNRKSSRPSVQRRTKNVVVDKPRSRLNKRRSNRLRMFDFSIMHQILRTDISQDTSGLFLLPVSVPRDLPLWSGRGGTESPLFGGAKRSKTAEAELAARLELPRSLNFSESCPNWFLLFVSISLARAGRN